jgi:hypothetical protein
MMRKPDTILDEIHAIRHDINEKTKHMTPSERTAYFNQHGEKSAKKYGFTIVSSEKKKIQFH